MNKELVVKVELIVLMAIIIVVLLFGQDIKAAIENAMSQYIAEQTDLLFEQLIR